MDSNHRPQHYQVCAGLTADLLKRTKMQVKGHLRLTEGDRW